MADVCVGDRAEAQRMGDRDPIAGWVRGISVSNVALSGRTAALRGYESLANRVLLSRD
jgi:hypothetical protein